MFSSSASPADLTGARTTHRTEDSMGDFFYNQDNLKYCRQCILGGQSPLGENKSSPISSVLAPWNTVLQPDPLVTPTSQRMEHTACWSPGALLLILLANHARHQSHHLLGRAGKIVLNEAHQTKAQR